MIAVSSSTVRGDKVIKVVLNLASHSLHNQPTSALKGSNFFSKIVKYELGGGGI